jgi:hypothetical protein
VCALRTSKHLGFLAVALGLSLLLLPAVLPTRFVSYGSGLTRMEVVDGGCGSTAYAAVRHPDHECGRLARQRLVVTSTAGLLLVVTGAVVLIGAHDRRRSRLTGSRRQS